MRKLLMDRDWNALKSETGHLMEGSHNFGFLEVSSEAEKTLKILKEKRLSRSSLDRETQLALESLFQSLDQFLARKLNSH